MTAIKSTGPSFLPSQLIEKKEITRTDVDAMVEQVVADEQMTKAERAALREALTHPCITDDAADAIKAFLAIENAGVRNFVARAGKDGEIDGTEAKGLLEMMIASKGISKREMRSVEKAKQFVNFTEEALEIIARGTLPESPTRIETLADLPAGAKVTIPLRGAAGHMDFNVAFVEKDQDGEVSLRLGEAPGQSWGFEDTTIPLDAEGKGRLNRANVPWHSQSKATINMSAEVAVVEGELEAKVHYSHVITAAQGGMGSTSAHFVGEQDDAYNHATDVGTVMGRFNGYPKQNGKVQIADGKVWLEPEGVLADAMEIKPGGKVEGETGGLKWSGQLESNGRLRLTKSDRFASIKQDGQIDPELMDRIRPMLFDE